MRLPKERSGFQTVHKRSITFRLGQIKEAGGATGLPARTWYRLGDASARGRFRGLRRGYFGGTVEQMINDESDSEGTSGRLAPAKARPPKRGSKAGDEQQIGRASCRARVCQYV